MQAAQAAGQPMFTQFTTLDGTEVPTVFTADKSSRTGYVPMAAPQPVFQSAKTAVFARVFGDVLYREGANNIPTLGAVANAAGLPVAGQNETRTRSFGFQAGIDRTISGLTSSDDGLLIGVLGGYLQSKLNVKNAPTTVDTSGGSVGVFGSYLRGPFFVDLSLRADLLSLDYNDGMTAATIGARNYNAVFSMGYKIGTTYYVEPVTGFEYTRSTFERPIAGPGYVVNLNDGENLRARVGARFGTVFVMNNLRIEPSVLVNLWGTIRNTNSTFFTSAATGDLILPDRKDRPYVEISPSVNFIALQTGVSAFARAEIRTGENLTSYGGRLGVRYQW